MCLTRRPDITHLVAGHRASGDPAPVLALSGDMAQKFQGMEACHRRGVRM